jgi:ribonuclease HI
VLRFGEHVRELTGGEPATTNNRMELQAAISALKALKEACDVTPFPVLFQRAGLPSTAFTD